MSEELSQSERLRGQSDELGPPAGDVRVRLAFGYDGTSFHGLAASNEVSTVAGTINAALSDLLGDETSIVVAGRTDKGVHAERQSAHFDVRAEVWRRNQETVRQRLAEALPATIPLHEVEEVGPEFHARRSALARIYRYRLNDGPRTDEIRHHPRVVWVEGRLDVEAMNAAAGGLIGEHDFRAFGETKTMNLMLQRGKSTVRTLYELTVSRDGDNVTVDTMGRAFIHSQVRLMVGALVEVGLRKQTPDWPASLLVSGVKQDLGKSPAKGLTFVTAVYPGDERARSIGR